MTIQKRTTFASAVRWKKGDATVVSDEQRAMLSDIDASIELFLKEIQKISPALSHLHKDIATVFKSTFHGPFFGEISAATVGNVFQLRQKIALGKDGVDYQMNRYFKGENALDATTFEQVRDLYIQFADGVQESIAPGSVLKAKAKGAGRS